MMTTLAYTHKCIPIVLLSVWVAAADTTTARAETRTIQAMDRPGVLVAYLIQGRQGTPYGMRFWQNGRVDMVETKRGKLGWHRIGRLKKVQVKQVNGYLQQADFFAISDILNQPLLNCNDCNDQTADWVGRSGKRKHHIKVSPWPSRSPDVKRLLKLIEQLTALR